MPTYRWILIFYVTCALSLRADQVEMQNGDRYAGTVVSLNGEALVMQSDVLGKVILPRTRVAVITLGATPLPAAYGPSHPTNAVPTTALAVTNSEIAAVLRKLGPNTNFIPKIRDQFLSGAGPEANGKFNELLGGLMSGQLDMNGLRAQVQSAVDQFKTLKKEGGSEAGESMDMYLGILEKFLKESAAPTDPPKTQSVPNH